MIKRKTRGQAPPPAHKYGREVVNITSPLIKWKEARAAKARVKERLREVRTNFTPEQRGALRRTRVREFLTSIGFLGPSFLGVIVFFILPFGVVIYYSFIKSSLDPSFAGLDNYTNLLKNPGFLLAMKNTGTFSALVVPLSVILSLTLALLLEARIPGKSHFRTFFLSPMMVPVASVVLIWHVVFSNNGVLNEFTALFGLDKVDWLNSDYAQWVVIFLFLWKNLGYNMILFMSALANVPGELLEVADVEGASPLYKFFAIKMRYLSPTILFVAILSLINSFKVFREVFLLAGSYPYEKLYTLQHFMNNMFNALNYQKLSAAAVIMAIAMIIIIAVLFAVENWFGKDVEG